MKNRKKVAVVFAGEDEKAPLYLRYVNQTNPQPAYVKLDCDRAELNAVSDGLIGGGMEVEEYHKRTLRWDVCNNLTGSAVVELLDEIAPLAQRVVNGYSSVWDGHNHVGRYTDDAAEAAAEIEKMCDESRYLETVEVWDSAEAWVECYDFDVRDWPDGATFETVAQAMNDNANENGIFINDDVAATLRDMALDAAAEDDHNLPVAVWRALGVTLGVVGCETDEECYEIAAKSPLENAGDAAVCAVRDALRDGRGSRNELR
jgi:hypothetical protein